MSDYIAMLGVLVVCCDPTLHFRLISLSWVATPRLLMHLPFHWKLTLGTRVAAAAIRTDVPVLTWIVSALIIIPVNTDVDRPLTILTT